MAWTTPRTWVTGELVTASLLNTHVRDNLDDLRRVIVRKSADESVTASTTFQDDNELLFAIAASELWVFDMLLFASCADAGVDIKLKITGPSGATISAAALGPDTAQSGFTADGRFLADPAAGTLQGGDLGAISNTPLWVTGSVLNGGNAGNVQLQWAQNSSNATLLYVRAGSRLIAHRRS